MDTYYNSRKLTRYSFLKGTLAASVSLSLVACGNSVVDDNVDQAGATSLQGKSAAVRTAATNVVNMPNFVPRAKCGPGSNPEQGLQGQVSLADRESGRSQQGYSCNLERIGQYQGEGTAWVNPFFRNCGYMATAGAGILKKKSQGVQVVDLSNPSSPTFSTNLISPAMFQGPWESLKVNEQRGLWVPLLQALG